MEGRQHLRSCEAIPRGQDRLQTFPMHWLGRKGFVFTTGDKGPWAQDTSDFTEAGLLLGHSGGLEREGRGRMYGRSLFEVNLGKRHSPLQILESDM